MSGNQRNDQEILQKDLDSLKAWSDEWLWKFYPKFQISVIVLQIYNWEKRG